MKDGWKGGRKEEVTTAGWGGNGEESIYLKKNGNENGENRKSMGKDFMGF